MIFQMPELVHKRIEELRGGSMQADHYDGLPETGIGVSDAIVELARRKILECFPAKFRRAFYIFQALKNIFRMVAGDGIIESHMPTVLLYMEIPAYHFFTFSNFR